MEYGTRKLDFTPFTKENPEPVNALPNYGETINLGGLNKVGVNPSYNEAKGFGDDATKVYVAKFKECLMPTSVTTLPKDAAAIVFGATSTEDGGLIFTKDDRAPYGALTFITPEVDDQNKETFTARFYPKAKAVRQGMEFASNGDSINLVYRNLQFTAVACNDGSWEHESPAFETEAEAEAWITEKLNGAVG